METIIVTNKNESAPVREKSIQPNFIEGLFYPFLKMNFALSVFLNQWREDRFSSLATKITCWQFFFFTGGLALWSLPPVKTKNDIYWTTSTLLFLLFCSLFGLNKWLQYIINKTKIGSRISRKRNLGKLTTLSIIISSLMFIGFSFAIILKWYLYHTRYYWWN